MVCSSRQTLDERLRVLEDARLMAIGTPQRVEACRVCYSMRDNDASTTPCLCGRSLWLPVELVIIELSLTLVLADAEAELRTDNVGA